MNDVPPRPAESSRVYAWLVTGFLTLAFTVSFIERIVMSLMVDPIKADLRLSDTEVSTLHGFAFVIFYVLMALPISRVTDRGSRRGVIAASIAVWSVATAACGLARDYWSLFLARIGVGVGEAGLSPASYSMLADLFPREELARPIAIYSLGIYLGSGLAFIAGGVAVDYIAALGTLYLPLVGLLQPWQATFLVVAAPGAVLLVVMLWIREPQRRRDSLSIEQPTVAQVLEYMRRHRGFFVTHFAGFSMLVVFMGAQLGWIPTFFIRRFGWSAAEVGVAYGSVFMAAGTLGVLLGGTVAAKLERGGHADALLRTAAIAAAVLVVPGIVATLLPAAGWVLAALAPGILCYAVAIALAPAILQRIAPSSMRAQLAAAYLFVATLVGLAGGPFAVGVFTDFVFRDEMSLGASLAGVAACTLPVGSWLLFRGLRHFRTLVASE